MKLCIIYTEDNIRLSKKRYGSWREIQDEYADYKTSLGPWEDEEVIEFLVDEYPSLEPSAQKQVSALVTGPEQERVLTFRRQQ